MRDARKGRRVVEEDNGWDVKRLAHTAHDARLSVDVCHVAQSLPVLHKSTLGVVGSSGNGPLQVIVDDSGV